jgi:hypothetical protein
LCFTFFAHLEEIDYSNSCVQAHPKASALATAMTKRKSSDRAAEASTVSLAPSSKKLKSTLTCTACGISANSEKAMQDHLNGKVHRKKVVALPELSKLVPDETEQEIGLEAGEEPGMAMETLGDYKSTKFMMATTAGALNEVTQMDGYLLCELCNVRTADRITMMCHLQGSKHISTGQKKHRPSSKPSGAAIATADPNKNLVLEDYSASLPHAVRRLEGLLLCELCDVKASSMNGMRQHLSGKKHKNKANTSSSDVSVNLSSGGKEVAKAQLIYTDHTAVISDDMAAKVEALLAKKSLQPKLGDDNELQEMTVAPPKEDVAIGDSTKTPGTEMMKSSATSVGAQLNNVCDSDSPTMEVDSVMHPLRRVDGFLVCLSCNAKASSEIIMQSHLAGKKHKRKMALAAARGNNDLSVIVTGADEAQDNGSKSIKSNVEAESAVPQAKTAANEDAESAPSLAVQQAMASMTVDPPVEAQPATCITEPAEEGEIIEEAEEEHVAADSSGSVTQAKESAITNYTTAPVKPIKIQLEGKVFIVMQQENGRLSCELCGVHGCDKDSMILHLYTRTHWGKASLAEKKEQQV